MADFPTSPLPSYPLEETATAPEVLVTVHRDGTEQRRLKGAGKKRTYKLVFGSALPITDAERITLKNHFAGQNGTLTAFNWTHPDRAETLLCRHSDIPERGARLLRGRG